MSHTANPRNIGLIAGAAAAGAVVLIVCIVLVAVTLFYWKNKHKEEEEEEIPNEIRFGLGKYFVCPSKFLPFLPSKIVSRFQEKDITVTSHLSVMNPN